MVRGWFLGQVFVGCHCCTLEPGSRQKCITGCEQLSVQVLCSSKQELPAQHWEQHWNRLEPNQSRVVSRRVSVHLPCPSS